MPPPKKPSNTTTAGDAHKLTHSPFAALKAQLGDKLPDQPASKPARKSEAAPEPAKLAPAKKSRGRLVLRRETKHRGGKAVIIITGISAVRDLDAAATEALAKRLKQQLGCGGTVEQRGKEREIVLQGDHPAKVAELLRAQGFRVDGVTS